MSDRVLCLESNLFGSQAMAATLVQAMSDLTLKEPEPKEESIMVEFKVPAASVLVHSSGPMYRPC